MIFVIPIHSSVPGIETLARDFKEAGKLNSHVLRLVSRQEDEGLAYTIGDQLSDNFLSVTTQTLPDRKRTAIELGNDFFEAAFMYRRGYKSGPDEFPDHPLFYFDPAYRPVPPAKRRWADTIQSEFFLKNATTMGRTTPGSDPKSRVFVGPVVLGSKFVSNLEILGFLEPTTLWRNRLMWQLMKGSVETRLIGSGNRSLVRIIQQTK